MDNYYAFRCNDKNILMRSSSGGAFYCMAKAVIDKCGSVYGVVIANDGKIEYSRAININEVFPMMGSKYAASSMSDDVWNLLIDDIRNDKQVLFTGTPCMIKGVRSFLNIKGIDTSNVLFCDFYRCHGGFSPALWEKECEIISGKGNIESVRFRDKTRSWRCFDFSYISANGEKKHKDFNLSPSGVFLGLSEARRRCCEKCVYVSGANRASDLSMGDFWNSAYLPKKWNDDRGVSLVVDHSEHGNMIHLDMQHYGCVEKVPIDIEDSGTCVSTSSAHDDMETKRKQFWNLFHAKGYNAIISNYCKDGFGDWIKFCVIRKLLVKTRVISLNDKYNNRKRLQKNG